MASSLRGILIGVLLIAVVGTGLWHFLVEGTGTYGSTIDPKYKEVFNQLNDTLNHTDIIARNIQEQVQTEEGINLLTLAQTGAAAVYEAIKLPFAMIPHIISVISVISEPLPIPNWFYGVIITIVITSIVFIFISALLRKDV